MDLWALGCLLYRMLLETTPFAAASEYLILERIASHDLQIPSTIAPAAQNLLRQLLDSDPGKRIGAACASCYLFGQQVTHMTGPPSQPKLTLLSC